MRTTALLFRSRDFAFTLRRLGGRTRGRVVDTGARVRGAFHELKARLTEGDVPDGVLEDRVRAAIGRVASRPRALRVGAVNGCIEVTGPILANEAEILVNCIRSVHGVKDVVERLELHEQPDDAYFQGGCPLTR